MEDGDKVRTQKERWERFSGKCVLNLGIEVHQGHEITRLVDQITQMRTIFNPKAKAIPSTVWSEMLLYLDIIPLFRTLIWTPRNEQRL